MRIVKFVAEALKREKVSKYICQKLLAGQPLSGETADISRIVVQPRNHTTVVVLLNQKLRIKAQVSRKPRDQKGTKPKKKMSLS